MTSPPATPRIPTISPLGCDAQHPRSMGRNPDRWPVPLDRAREPPPIRRGIGDRRRRRIDDRRDHDAGDRVGGLIGGPATYVDELLEDRRRGQGEGEVGSRRAGTGRSQAPLGVKAAADDPQVRSSHRVHLRQLGAQVLVNPASPQREGDEWPASIPQLERCVQHPAQGGLAMRAAKHRLELVVQADLSQPRGRSAGWHRPAIRPAVRRSPEYRREAHRAPEWAVQARPTAGPARRARRTTAAVLLTQGLQAGLIVHHKRAATDQQ